MSLRFQVLAIVTGLTVVLVAFLQLVPARIMLRGFADLERTQVLKDLDGARAALDREQKRLLAVAADWAWWDDARNFVLGRFPEFRKVNLGVTSLRYLDVTVLAYCDLQGRTVAAVAYDHRAKRAVAPPAGLIRQYCRAQSSHGLVSDGGVLYAVATEPVLSSAYAGPSAGTLIVARELDGELQNTFSEAFGGRLKLRPRRPEEQQEADCVPRVAALSREQIRGTVALRDAAAQPSIILDVTIPRDITARGRQGAQAFAAATGAIGIIFGLGVVLLLQTRLISRIERLTRSVVDIARTDGASHRLPVDGADELATLARSANRMLVALDASRERLRLTQFAVDQAGEGVYLIDADGRIAYANEAACRALDYPSGGLAGVSFEEIDLNVKRQPWAQTMEHLRRDGPQTFITRHRRSGGAFRNVEVNLAAITYRDNHFCAGVARDISDRQHAEYSHRLTALGQLAAGVAHEFNNVLAGMVLSAEGIARLAAPPEAWRLAETIVRAGSRGAAICRSLTAIARPSAGNREAVFAEDCVRAALDLSAPALRDSEVDVVRDLAAQGQVVMADPGNLEQVFLNLIINATHAMPRGGRLTIATRYETPEGSPPSVIISVTDTGTGIDDEHLPHIFEPFFTTKGRLGDSDLPGTGLGLSVSHGIVAGLGGRMDVETELGRGSTFTVTLPLAAQPAQAAPPQADPGLPPAPPAAARSGVPAGALRVLLAEDEVDLGSILAEAMQDFGHTVTYVADARDAVTQLAGEPWDVVVSDLMMPGGGGRTVLAAALDLPRPPAVIMVTGRGDATVLDELRQLGATACLQKPFGLIDLLDLVRDAGATRGDAAGSLS
jgi:PAS domain S-box-containing protein